MNIASMDLNLLLIFQSLYETRSVSISARKLGLSQPALSNALNRLRKTLNDELFIRSPSGMMPTNKSNELFPHIQQIFFLLGTKVLSDEQFDFKKTNKTFSLCATDNEILTYINSIICDPAIAESNLKFKLTFPREIDFFSNMENGKVDLSFGVNIPKRKNFEIQKISAKGYKVLSRSKISNQKRLTLKQFLSMSHMLVSPLGGETGVVDVELEKLKAQRIISLILPSFSLVPEFLGSRDFIITLPEVVATKFQSDYGFYIYDLPFQMPKVEIEMVWHKSLNSDPAHNWLLNTIREKVKNI